MNKSSSKFDYIALGRELLTALVWGAALSVGSLETHTSYGIAGAFIGGCAGSLLGYYLKGTKVRSIAVIVGALLLYPLWSLLCSWQINSTILASALGINNAYLFYDGCQSLGTSLLTVTALHTLAWRWPAFTAIELIVIAIALATPLAGHRDGFICRPYGFVDAIWSRGYDPIPFFKAFGVMVAALFIMATAGRYNKRSTIVDLGIMLMLALILSTFTLPNVLTQPLPEQAQNGPQGESRETPPPPPSKDKDKNKQQNQGQDQKQNQNQDQDQDQDKDQDNGQGQSDSNNKDKKNNQDEDRPVAVVVFYQDYEPKDGELFFRQSTQSFYNGKRLTEETNTSYDSDIATHFPQPGANSEAVLKPIKVKDSQMAYLKPVTTKVCLMTTHPLPFGLVTPTNMVALNNPNPNQFIRAYQVQSQCFTGDFKQLLSYSVGESTWEQDKWDHYLARPEDERYDDLAQKIVSDMASAYDDNPLAQVLACKLWLEENCIYDSSKKVDDQNDVVAKFLFSEDGRVGYCIHLAHSLTTLARTLKVPARVATGYAADARNRYGGSSLLLQGSNSHAWCEVYLSGLGWIPIEVTPKESRSQEGTPPDAELQKMLGQLAREESGNGNDKPTAPRNLQLSVQQFLIASGKLLGVLAILLVIACYIAKIVRRCSPMFSTMPKRIDVTYRVALDRLSDVGVRRHYGEAREDFAVRLSDKVPALRQLTDLHMRKALGEKGAVPHADGAALSKTFAEFNGQLRQHFPLWRRCLGALNPFSWLLTK